MLLVIVFLFGFVSTVTRMRMGLMIVPFVSIQARTPRVYKCS